MFVRRRKELWILKKTYSNIFIKKDQNTADNTRILRIFNIIQKKKKIWILPFVRRSNITFQYKFNLYLTLSIVQRNMKK